MSLQPPGILLVTSEPPPRTVGAGLGLPNEGDLDQTLGKIHHQAIQGNTEESYKTG